MAAPPPVGPISLHKRLILIPAVVAVVASVLAMAVIIHQARQRVVAERISAGALAEQLMGAAIGSLPGGTADPLAALTEVVDALSGLRHVRLFVLPRQEKAFGRYQSTRGTSQDAPDWFAEMLRPPPWEYRREILYEGRTIGYAVVVADPEDEIAELWHEMLLVAALLAALTAIFVGLVSWSVSRALHPLGLLSGGLDRLESGDFSAALPPFGIAELTRLGEKFNRLAQTLARISRDNRMLIGQLISLQETERKLLAHELHDELGPCLFGIKAQAACISRLGQDGEGHARTILGLVDELQNFNRRILGRLRPIALQDLGVAAAVAQLVADWRSREPQIEWRFDCPAFEAAPSEAIALTLYRVVQECLTNAARHSGATRVVVEIESGTAESFAATGLEWRNAVDTPLAYVAVSDDGRGIDPEGQQGFGLIGIHERVRSHGGTVRVISDSGHGTVIEVLLPLTPAMQGNAP